MQVGETYTGENFTANNNTLSNHEHLHNALQRAINDITKIEAYVKYTANHRIINTSGDSFLGVLCEIDIQGKTIEGDKRSNIFLKISNADQEVAFVDSSQAYFNEIYVYKELFDIYASIQEEYNVPLVERYNMIKFYDVCSQDVIAMENMREKGFVTYHKTELASLDFIELALIELAKFHALSFVLENKRPTYFEKKIKNMKYIMKFNKEWTTLITALTETAIKYVVDKDVEVRLVQFLKDLTKKYVMHIHDENIIRCLCHGDYRSSNILMNNVGGAISKVIPIDYQLIYYGCPVLDFLYLVFEKTDREFRREHLSRLKDLYHDTLNTFLGYFNIQVETVYPRKEFERVFKEKLEYGLMVTLILTPLFFVNEDMLDLSATPVSTQETNDECKRRILGSIDEFIAWGYL